MNDDLNTLAAYGPVGRAAADFLRVKRLRDRSRQAYYQVLLLFTREFPDHQLYHFNPREGTRLVEDFLARHWGTHAPATYEKSLSVLHSFFEWHALRGNITADPTTLIERKKKQTVARTTFSDAQVDAIYEANSDPRDRVPLRLLLDFGISKGALQRLRFENFDDERRRLVVRGKAGRVYELPMVDAALWNDLAELRASNPETTKPEHYLLPQQIMRRKAPPKKRELDRIRADLDALINRARQVEALLPERDVRSFVSSLENAQNWLHRARLESSRQIVRRVPTEPFGDHGVHDWWYRCLQRAGIVEPGVTRGEPMHKARQTAGQRILDRTGSIKMAQALLGHRSVQTTSDSYSDPDIERLADALSEAMERAEDRQQ